MERADSHWTTMVTSGHLDRRGRTIARVRPTERPKTGKPCAMPTSSPRPMASICSSVAPTQHDTLSGSIMTRREEIAAQSARVLETLIARGLMISSLVGMFAPSLPIRWEYNAPYKAFCQGRENYPGCSGRWQDIPPAPAAAFKSFILTCAPEAMCHPATGGRTFHPPVRPTRNQSALSADASAVVVVSSVPCVIVYPPVLCYRMVKRPKPSR